MAWRYKNIAVNPDDFERLAKLANGMPMNRIIGLILDTLEKNNLRIVDISTLPCPEDCMAVPLITVATGE